MKLLIAILLFVVSASHSVAGFMTGRDLTAACKSDNTDLIWNCSGYLMGLADYMQEGGLHADGVSALCSFPKNDRELIDTYLDTMSRQPLLWKSSASIGAVAAILDKYGCDHKNMLLK